jgi:hypothetical protein
MDYYPMSPYGSREDWPDPFFGEFDESFGGAFVPAGDANRCCKEIGPLGIEPYTRTKDTKPWRFDDLDNAAPIALRHPKNRCEPKRKHNPITPRNGHLVVFWTDKKAKAWAVHLEFNSQKLFLVEVSGNLRGRHFWRDKPVENGSYRSEVNKYRTVMDRIQSGNANELSDENENTPDLMEPKVRIA